MIHYEQLIGRILKAVEPLKQDAVLYKTTFEKCLDHALAESAPNPGPGNGPVAETPVETGERKAQRITGARRPSRKKFNPASIRSEVQNLNPGAGSPTLKPLSHFRSKADKCLWLLAFAHEHSVDGLSFNEVAYLMTEKLKTVMAAKNVGNALKAAVRKNYTYWEKVNDTNGIKIQADGLAFCGK